MEPGDPDLRTLLKYREDVLENPKDMRSKAFAMEEWVHGSKQVGTRLSWSSALSDASRDVTARPLFFHGDSVMLAGRKPPVGEGRGTSTQRLKLIREYKPDTEQNTTAQSCLQDAIQRDMERYPLWRRSLPAASHYVKRDAVGPLVLPSLTKRVPTRREHATYRWNGEAIAADDDEERNRRQQQTQVMRELPVPFTVESSKVGTLCPAPLHYPVSYQDLFVEQMILADEQDVHKKAYESAKQMYYEEVQFVRSSFTAMIEGRFFETHAGAPGLRSIPTVDACQLRLQRDTVPTMMVVHHEDQNDDDDLM